MTTSSSGSSTPRIHWTDQKTDQKGEHGVIGTDVIAPSTVDAIEQDGPGAVRFEWLMPRPPATAVEVEAIAEKAQRLLFRRQHPDLGGSEVAISASLAMLLIFALMWWFFRHVRLVIAPMVSGDPEHGGC